MVTTPAEPTLASCLRCESLVLVPPRLGLADPPGVLPALGLIDPGLTIAYDLGWALFPDDLPVQWFIYPVGPDGRVRMENRPHECEHP